MKLDQKYAFNILAVMRFIKIFLTHYLDALNILILFRLFTKGRQFVIIRSIMVLKWPFLNYSQTSIMRTLNNAETSILRTVPVSTKKITT